MLLSAGTSHCGRLYTLHSTCIVQQVFGPALLLCSVTGNEPGRWLLLSPCLPYQAAGPVTVRAARLAASVLQGVGPLAS
jgi:hypothetical protein